MRDVQNALRDLKAAGFPAHDIRVLTGKAGAHRIDVKGDGHGLLAHVVRSVQELLGSTKSDTKLGGKKKCSQVILALESSLASQ